METPEKNKEADLPQTPDPPQIINPSSPKERADKKKAVAGSTNKSTPAKKKKKALRKR